MPKRRGAGTYWRIMWSTDWWGRYPWAVDGVLMPYIGARTQNDGRARFWTIGPIMVTALTLKGSGHD